MIEVVNVKGMKPNTPGITYIGREFAGWKGSCLGNPFSEKAHGLNECLEMYRVWLWEKIQCKQGAEYKTLMGFVDLNKMGANIVLGCWCKPKPCHGDILNPQSSI